MSSVRRLVSTDARPRPVTRDLGPDRLVLTPALRVVGDAPAALAPLILTLPAEPAEAVEEAAPDAAPVAASGAEPGAAPEVAPAAEEAEWEDEIWQEPEPPLAELALGAEEAELVAPVAEDGDDGVWAEAGADWPEEEGLATVIPIGVRTAAPVAPSVPPEPGPEPAADPVAAPVAAPVADAVAAPDPAPVADAAAPADAPQEGEAGDDAAASPMLYDKDGNPLTVLDEDALQEIVRALIREELQGVLGERITRNVRKLVRAEINRALTARALD